MIEIERHQLVTLALCEQSTNPKHSAECYENVALDCLVTLHHNVALLKARFIL